MPFDSNGTFNRVIPGGWKADAAANIKIRADRHDDEDDGFATGLSTCITKDGRTQPTANIPLNNKKLVNVGEPTNPSDAATKNYVDNFKSFTTGANISGAGPINGFINFTSPTGINGIGWTTADMSWVGKLEEALKTSKRLTVNDKKDGTGLDVTIVDETGRINNTGWLTSNLSYDGTAWRTIALGTGTALSYAAGSFGVSSNDTATTVDYQSATLRSFFTVANADGNMTASLYKKEVKKAVDLNAYTGTSLRWKMSLGDATDETATRAGSDFVITGYANAGDAPVRELKIFRDTHEVCVAGPITGPTAMIIAPAVPEPRPVTPVALNGSIILRPDGVGFPLSGTIINSVGSLQVCQASNGAVTGGTYAGAGVMSRTGSSGNYGTVWANMYYSSPDMRVYANASYLGDIYWQVACDYRIKKNAKPLPSMWEGIKALKPISYGIKAFRHIEEDDKVHWGFTAHEMQEALGEIAATGVKDDPDTIQKPDQWLLITALTKALQEAMLRIEALEARA
jgi:hypothetical protein